jgi:hypothetical protein
MQEKKACLRRDREADLVSHFKTAASLEMLFGQKDLNMTQQLDLIRVWKSPEDWNIAGNDQPPGRRKWFRLQLLATALFRKPKGHAGIFDF